MPKPVFIDEDACDGCSICYSTFGCPAIGVKPGGKAFIHNELCNGNGSCIQVCPVQAIKRPAPAKAPAGSPTGGVKEQG